MSLRTGIQAWGLCSKPLTLHPAVGADPGSTDLGLTLGLCHLIALLLGQVAHLSAWQGKLQGKCSLSRNPQIMIRRSEFLQIKWVLEILCVCLNLWECMLTVGLLVAFNVAVSQTSQTSQTLCVENIACASHKSSWDCQYHPLPSPRLVGLQAPGYHCVDFRYHTLSAWQSAWHIAGTRCLFREYRIVLSFSLKFLLLPRCPYTVTPTKILVPCITYLNILNGSPSQKGKCMNPAYLSDPSFCSSRRFSELQLNRNDSVFLGTSWLHTSVFSHVPPSGWTPVYEKWEDG